MSKVEDKLSEFENCIRRFIKADEIIFMLLTSNEQSTAYFKDLTSIENFVKALNDEKLTDLFNRILEDVSASSLYQQVRPNNYFSFVQRLGTLLNEATIQVNEANIALRGVLGLQSGSGLCDGKGWCP